MLEFFKKGIFQKYTYGLGTRHFSPSLSESGDMCLKLSSQKRSPGQNLREHHLVLRPGTASRGAALFELCMKYFSYWNQTLQHSCKLSFYHSIKKNYILSACLYSTQKNIRKITLVKLRIGCHNLRAETGRTKSLSRDERIYPLCGGNKIEDETHLLLDCQRYSSMRDKSLSKYSLWFSLCSFFS